MRSRLPALMLVSFGHLACEGRLESGPAGEASAVGATFSEPDGAFASPPPPESRGPERPPVAPLPTPTAPPTAPPPAPPTAAPTSAPTAPPPEPGAPEPDAPEPPETSDATLACGESRPAPKVYNGTLTPTWLPLEPAQQLAIGTFGGCTGALIAPTFVLSASHCGHSVGAEFCMGPDPDDPSDCVRARAVHENPDGDMTVLELDRPATEVQPGVVPIPILTEMMDDSWLGRTAEAAGYGQRDDGGYGGRRFTAEPISDLGGGLLTIDGQGRRGVCFGDSGGPVMVLASDGSARVAGDLSYGDPSCLGQDNYTRVDEHRAWIEGITGPTLEPGGCSGATATGRCIDGRAVYCEHDERRTDECPGDCGWSSDADGFRCIDGEDPCQGVDQAGHCEGENARFCVDGVLHLRDCVACEQTCGIGPIGADCVTDVCGGLDYLGECTGDTARWCEDGQIRTQDCAREGRGCGWVDGETGWFCR